MGQRPRLVRKKAIGHRPRLLCRGEVRAVLPSCWRRKPWPAPANVWCSKRLPSAFIAESVGGTVAPTACVLSPVQAEHGHLDVGERGRLRRRAVVDDGRALARRARDRGCEGGASRPSRSRPRRSASSAAGRPCRTARPRRSGAARRSDCERADGGRGRRCARPYRRRGGRDLAGEQVGRDGDEAVGGELVGHPAHPGGEAEDLVHDDDDGRLGRALRIDHPGAHAVRRPRPDHGVLAVARDLAIRSATVLAPAEWASPTAAMAPAVSAPAVAAHSWPACASPQVSLCAPIAPRNGSLRGNAVRARTSSVISTENGMMAPETICIKRHRSARRR